MKSNKFVEELKTKSDAELAQELVAAVCGFGRSKMRALMVSEVV